MIANTYNPSTIHSSIAGVLATHLLMQLNCFCECNPSPIYNSTDTEFLSHLLNTTQLLYTAQLLNCCCTSNLSTIYNSTAYIHLTNLLLYKQPICKNKSTTTVHVTRLQYATCSTAGVLATHMMYTIQLLLGIHLLNTTQLLLYLQPI